MKKIINSIDVHDLEVLTPNGYVDIHQVHKTKPLTEYTILLKNGMSLICADTHILIDENSNQIFAKDSLNQKIQTKDGLSEVIEVVDNKRESNMYDISIDSDDHTYYTDGILSHNTTLATIIILHEVIFNSDKNFFILANKEATSKEVLERIKLAFMYLPDHIKPGVEIWDKTNIKFDNRSKVYAATTSSDSIRGKTGSIYVDECGFITGNPSFSDFFNSTFPVLSSGKTSKAILTSTPNGLNHWYKMWNDAVHGESEFFPIEMKWDDIPGRDEEWKKKTIGTIGIESWLQEFEGEFMGSSNSLIPSSVLKEIVIKEPIDIKEKVLYYEYPIVGHNYTMTVDTSRGKNLDYSVSMIFDTTTYPFRQVAIFRDNETSPLLYPNILAQLGYQYNEAHILVENNDMGEAVVNSLNYDLEYENIINEKTNKETSVDYSLGVKTTKLTKQIGCANLKAMLEMHKLIVVDKETVFELSNFISKGNSYEADKGFHDDMVMCLVMMSWYAQTENFSEDMKYTVKEEMFANQIKRLEEELAPFGYIGNGIEEETNITIENGERWELENF